MICLSVGFKASLCVIIIFGGKLVSVLCIERKSWKEALKMVKSGYLWFVGLQVILNFALFLNSFSVLLKFPTWIM